MTDPGGLAARVRTTPSGGRTGMTTTPDRTLAAAGRHSAGRVTAAFLCSVAAAVVALAEPAVLGHTLELLLADRPRAGTWVLLCTLLVTAEVLLDAGTAALTGTIGARSTAWLRRGALTRLLGTSPHHATRFPAGDLATRFTAQATDAGTVPATAATGLAALLPPLGGLIALFVIDLWTALAFLAGLPLLLLLLRAFARDASASVSAYQQAQLGISERLVEALGGARTIAAAGTVDRERRRVLSGLALLGTEGRRMWRVYGATVARSTALMPLLLAVVLAVAGIRLASGHLGVGELLAASRYAALAAGAGAVTGQLAALVRGRAAARRTHELLALPRPAHGTAPLPDGPGTLELRGVSVVREGRTLLHEVDLLVPGGSTAAVVGRSGSGKSLLAAVAGRLTPPDAGTVLLDGLPLDAADPAQLRAEIGYAFERPALFGRTVTEALAFGTGPTPDPAAIVAAARAADADGFVRRLPHGYDTPPTDAPLSGGEYQRLGLARAFHRAGRLLILDDALSGLDTVTAHRVERALAREVRAGTRLVITHRVSAAAGADLVVWLDDGRVRATGTHRALWRDPAYRAVFTETPHGPGAEAPTRATTEVAASTVTTTTTTTATGTGTATGREAGTEAGAVR
ncbi:ABC transporter ATP-binding protein [Streptomyces sp. NPDC097619]|uniref:ABC transporter ATP-binding protein n=1 Tax=Streptomyces sp. NPDC097619 TaxID=3157228 RepID=UPI00332DCC40